MIQQFFSPLHWQWTSLKQATTEKMSYPIRYTREVATLYKRMLELGPRLPFTVTSWKRDVRPALDNFSAVEKLYNAWPFVERLLQIYVQAVESQEPPQAGWKIRSLWVRVTPTPVAFSLSLSTPEDDERSQKSLRHSFHELPLTTPRSLQEKTIL